MNVLQLAPSLPIDRLEGRRSGPRTPIFVGMCAVAGFAAWLVVLAYHNVADGDLWAKLILGAVWWERGEVLSRDLFAFTPVLPEYVDHEWGSGVVFYAVLKLLGPGGLMLLKMALGGATLGVAALAARRAGAGWMPILGMAPLAALALLPGFTPVVRSHAFSYLFFAVTLTGLEALRQPRARWAPVLVLMMIAWVNLHGGFVAGLGAIGVYSLAELARHRRPGWTTWTLVGCIAATLVTPYGVKFWTVLGHALLHPRTEITEWQPLPWLGDDAFVGFRVLFAVTVVMVAVARRGLGRLSGGAITMLILTAILPWTSRRHAPFFGVTALMFLPVMLDAAVAASRAATGRRFGPDRGGWSGAILGLGVVYASLMVWVLVRLAPSASIGVLAPVGVFPVREVDILASSGCSGRVAVPFGWGSYVTWRLYPRFRVSIDGRYEAAYPESTFRLNQAFYRKQGGDWDRLVRDYPVDYVILGEAEGDLRPADLVERGFVLIWEQPGASALLARPSVAPELIAAARALPPHTIDPVDAALPLGWIRSLDRKSP